VKFEERQQINRPSSDVFQALSRPDLYLPKWSKGVLSATLVANPLDELQAEYRITGRDLTGKAHWRYQVTRCEPGRVFAARATGGSVPFTESFTLRSLPDGTTEVVHVQEIHPRGLFSLLGPVLPFVWPSLIRENLGRLKKFIEMRKQPFSPAASSS
jgi:uncharacterized protein YndB with AHSA1/START domain